MAKEPNLFLEYISEKQGDTLHRAVHSFLIRNKYLVENKLGSRYRVTFIELEDLDYQSVRFEDKGGDKIEFDILVIPEITAKVVYGKHNDRDVESVTDVWLTITCSGVVSDDLISFKIEGISEYNKKKREKPLSCDLVPIITRDDYEKYATEILQKFYPAGLEKPCAIDVLTIAKNMGISVVDRSISADGSIFGQVYFKDTKADLYDRRSGTMQMISVPKNTMIIDSDSSSLFSFGCQKLTIAHECVHFYLHKKAFFFARMVNKELSHIQCQREGGLVGKNEGTNNHWMEVQANGIAPYILMPRQMVIKKYNELENMYLSWGLKPLEYAENLVKAIADFFDVTNYAARKRLLDLGYTLAGGTLNFVDGQYIKPYLYKKGALAKNETYTVSYKDVYDKIFTAPTMGAYIYQGNFVFVENHLCIESPKFVRQTKEGDHELTDYAREHLDECCVKFKCTSRSSVIRDSLATACYLCRQFDEDLYYDLEIADSNGPLYNSPDLPFAFKEHRERILQIKKDIMGKSFTEILNYFVDNLHKDNKELAYELGLDERSIRRYLSGESKRPDKRSVIAICMALKLPPEITDIVLKQAHVSLVEGDNEDDALMGVIMTHRGKSIKKINAYLERLGVEPLNNASF